MNRLCTRPRKMHFIVVQALTLVRIVLAVVFAVVLLSSAELLEPPDLILYSLCVCILVLIELTDLLDGCYARRFGVVSEWGAMLDPYCDSISRIVVYWTLAQAELALPWVPLAMVFRDITVAYCRIILAQHGKPVSARLSGKLKAILQGVGAMMLLLGPLYWPLTGSWTRAVLSYCVIAVTIASIGEYLSGAATAARKNAS